MLQYYIVEVPIGPPVLCYRDSRLVLRYYIVMLPTGLQVLCSGIAHRSCGLTMAEASHEWRPREAPTNY